MSATLAHLAKAVHESNSYSVIQYIKNATLEHWVFAELTSPKIFFPSKCYLCGRTHVWIDRILTSSPSGTKIADNIFRIRKQIRVHPNMQAKQNWARKQNYAKYQSTNKGTAATGKREGRPGSLGKGANPAATRRSCRRRGA